MASSRPAGTYLGPLLAGWRLQWGRCTEPEGPRHFSPNTVLFQEPEKEGDLDEGTQQVGDRAGTETVASGLLVQCSALRSPRGLVGGSEMCTCVPWAGKAKPQMRMGEGLAKKPPEQKEGASPWRRVGSMQVPPAPRADSISEGTETSDRRGN